MTDFYEAARSLDCDGLQARWCRARDGRFAKLRTLLACTAPINVTAVVSGIRAERGHLVQAPFRLLPMYDPAADICLINSNAALNPEWGRRLAEMREVAPECLYVCWLIDHHHAYREMRQMCEAFDVVVPAHFTSLDYLYGGPAIVTSPVPCPSEQWYPEDAASFFLKHQAVPRSDRLYGGFREYHGQPRNGFIESLARDVPESAVMLLSASDQAAPTSYFQLDEEGRFADWMGYKASVVVCIKNDIPLRLFDALLTGQVPIVPWDMVGLDHVIAPEDQARLPVLRYTRYDAGHVAGLRDAAVAAYDRDGIEGAIHRHRYAMDNHLTVNRVRRILDLLAAFAALSAP